MSTPITISYWGGYAFAWGTMSGTELCATRSNVSNKNFKQDKIMSSILEEIETKIEELKTSTTKSNVGVVRETGDGVARIEGLSDVMLNEMIEFPNGVFGLALNLEETEVGAILMGETAKVSEGDEAKTTRSEERRVGK